MARGAGIVSGFERWLRQQGLVDPGKSPIYTDPDIEQRMQGVDDQYIQELGNLNAEAAATAREAGQPLKYGTVDYLLRAAQIGLPIAAMLGGGKRTGPAMMMGGQAAGGIADVLDARERQQRQAEYGPRLGEIGGQEEIAGIRHETGLGQIKAGRQAMESDRAYGLARGHLDVAQERERRMGLPGPEKPRFTPLQEINLAEKQEKQRQSDVLRRADMWAKQNIPWNLWPQGVYDINSIEDLQSVFTLVPGGQGPILGGGSGLQQFIDEYYGGQSQLPTSDELTPEERRELEEYRRTQGDLR